MKTRRFTFSQLGVYALLTLGALFVLYPFFYMVMNSVKPGPEILNEPMRLPSRVTFSGYLDVFRRLDMLRLFGNSLFISLSVTLLNTALSALAAYAVAKIPFPGRDRLFAFMLSTMMIPGVLFLIPTYVIIYNLGWVGQFHALIIPSAVSVYNIFLIRQFMVSIPNELLEAVDPFLGEELEHPPVVHLGKLAHHQQPVPLRRRPLFDAPDDAQIERVAEGRNDETERPGTLRGEPPGEGARFVAVLLDDLEHPPPRLRMHPVEPVHDPRDGADGDARTLGDFGYGYPALVGLVHKNPDSRFVKALLLYKTSGLLSTEIVILCKSGVNIATGKAPLNQTPNEETGVCAGNCELCWLGYLTTAGGSRG